MPIEPLAKQSTRFSRGRAYIDPKYLEWQKRFMWLAKQASPKFCQARFARGVSVCIHYYCPPPKGFPSREAVLNWTIEKQEKMGVCVSDWGVVFKTSKPDLPDNLNKLPLDTLTKMMVLRDDAIVCAFNATKVYTWDEPRIFIEISEF